VQNLKETRVIDPILTAVVQGYRCPGLVGEALFPRVPVQQSGGSILSFNKESFKLYNTLRAPGSATRRITFGYAGKPYSLTNHSLEAPVPREMQRDASQVPNIDLSKRAVELVMGVTLRELEYDQAKLATDPANYDNNHKAKDLKWGDPASKPVDDIEDGKEEIRKTIGIRPNTMLLSPIAYRLLRNHPTIIDRYKYTTHELLTTALLSAHFEIPNIVVGEGIWANDKDKFTDTWGNHAILAYVPPMPSSAEEPSYGYTYAMEGHPLTEEAYYEDNIKSWVYGVSFERAPVIAGMEAGFLFQNVD
jgi:hypothetical protein